MATKKLTRSSNKMLAGICGGIADYLNVDPTIIRVIYAVLTLFSAAFPGILLYIILLLIVPERPDDSSKGFDDAEVVE